MIENKKGESNSPFCIVSVSFYYIKIDFHQRFNALSTEG